MEDTYKAGYDKSNEKTLKNFTSTRKQKCY